MPSSTELLSRFSPPFVLLEDRLAEAGSAQLYCQPEDIVRCDEAADVPAALRRLDDGLARGLHAAGFLAYELGYVFEQRLAGSLPPDRPVPLLWFGLFREPLQIDPGDLDQAFATLAPPPPITAVTPALSPSGHVARVRQVLDYLAAGDAYQINLTFPVDFRFDGDPLALYAALRASQPVSHGGIVTCDEATILSVSPELFLEVRDGRATTRPMKGTAARHSASGADREAMAALRADPKQRAENLMIVDLLRNDLGRISEIGSVAVPSLFTVETYPTLHTLTSTVTARLKAPLSVDDLLRATFPCGSITGAPKVRAMQIIRELEDGPRGVYSGSIGTITPDLDLRFNVAIRTATLLPDGTGRYGIGGGIVADSEPESEYAEALLKAQVLTDLSDDFGLIETFRWAKADGFVRQALHLNRLENSAGALGFHFERAAAESRLAALAASWSANDDRRVRLELRRGGDLQIAAPVLVAEPERPLDAMLAQVAADAGDPFLRHKTTRRGRYESALSAALDRGADEAILLNRSGAVTEATRSNIFVERGKVLMTPPLSDGVLPGILRQVLIDEGRAVEARITPADLRSGARWFLGNSLRGLRLARLRD